MDRSGLFFRVGRGGKAIYIYIRSRDSGAQGGSPVVQGEHLRGSGSMREATWAQDGRRETQVEPRWTQVGAMLGLGRPNMIKMGPKLVQDEPQVGPRWSQVGPRWAQDSPS